MSTGRQVKKEEEPEESETGDNSHPYPFLPISVLLPVNFLFSYEDLDGHKKHKKTLKVGTLACR